MQRRSLGRIKSGSPLAHCPIQDPCVSIKMKNLGVEYITGRSKFPEQAAMNQQCPLEYIRKALETTAEDWP